MVDSVMLERWVDLALAGALVLFIFCLIVSAIRMRREASRRIG